MLRHLSIGLMGAAIATTILPAHAQEWTDIMYKTKNGTIPLEDDHWEFYFFNEKTGNKKLFSTKSFGGSNTVLNERLHFDSNNGRLRLATDPDILFEYNPLLEKWIKIGTDPKSSVPEAGFVSLPGVIGNEDGTVSIGLGSRKINLDGEGIIANGKNLISDKNGAIHIGENSLITIEEDGRQKLYAKDAEGNAIPIDITEGSDLLIDGVSLKETFDSLTPHIDGDGVRAVKTAILENRDNIETNRQNINDLGSGVAGATALTAALSSLPVAADDAPFSCGVGTGGYSSRFAMGIGCAARLNERLSFNVGGSHVFGGSSNYGGGSLDTVAARAGFVFKLGTVHKPATSSEEQLQSQLDEVKQENAAIRKENQDLIARLERLEAIALGKQSATTTASLK